MLYLKLYEENLSWLYDNTGINESNVTSMLFSCENIDFKMKT